jgi:Transglutaminase-like superfamily
MMGADLTDREHTWWSDPEHHAPRLSELPQAPAAIADALEEFVIPAVVARQLGFDVPSAAQQDRKLRRVALLLGEAVQRDSRRLSEHRAMADYLYVTCRDFALLAVSTLREHGIPARLRAGFARYFKPGYWEDHWVCEFRFRDRWSILDAQLGPHARKGLGISFDIADVPDTGWRSAASIWRSVRTGEVQPGVCGLSFAGIIGEWWIAASVVRDAAALAGIESLPWDRWGLARSFHATRNVTPEQALDVDALARVTHPAPNSREEARKLLDEFPWAGPQS